MKVVHLNTNVNVSSAPYRLSEAMNKEGIDSIVLTLNESNLPNTVCVKKTISYKVKRKIAAYKRKQEEQKYDKTSYMPFDIEPFGLDVTKIKEVRETDLIWLHWINGDFLSIESIEKILKMNKPVFWTCHDNFPFTGGCHVRLGCDGYQTKCGNCPILHSKQENDVSRRLIEKKQKLLNYDNLTIISPSTWMDQNVSKSTLFRNTKHSIIPNVIDTEVFKPYDKKEARTKLNISVDNFVILIGLKANQSIPYNGTEYLWEAISKFQNKCTNGIYNGKKVELVIFGVEEIDIPENITFETKNIGFIKQQAELAQLYSAADVYLITSLEDSFNQSAAECMACGTSVVAFNNGGLADIIDHKVNGYLAELKNVEELNEGIEWIFLNKNEDGCITKILNSFASHVIVKHLIDLF